jgi:hypothetical protein
MRRSSLILVPGLLLLLAGCKSISIDSPADRGLYGAGPEFRVSFSGGAPSALKLELNGKDVTGLFTVDSSGASAPAAALADRLLEGDNKFSAKDGMSGRTVTFILDTQGPSVRISSVKPGNPLEIQGRLEDRAGVQSLSINGKSVPLSADRFTAQVAETTFVEFTAADKMGHVSKTVYARPGTALASTAVARLNKSGLAFLIQELNAYLATLNYTELVKALNPLFDEGGWAASARVDATKVTLNPPKLTLVVSPTVARSFDVRVEIVSFVVDVKASGTILGIPWSTTGKVWASSAVFNGRATVHAADPKLDVTIGNLSAVLNGFGFDIAGFPDVLEGLFFDMVKGLLQDMIREQMAARIPAYIEEFLADVPSDFQFTFNGASFELAALPASIKTFLDGLTVHLGGWLKALTKADVPPALGSVYVHAAAPDLDVKTPGGVAYDAGAAMSVNMMNQGLLAAYQAGLLHLLLDDESNRLISPAGLADLSLEMSDAALTDSLRFRIIPAGPPFVGVQGRPTALVSLGLNEFEFRLEMLRQSDNTWRLVFGAILDMEVPFDIGVTDDNTIQVSFEEVPKVRVHSVDDGGIIAIDPGFVQKTLDRLLPLALPYLAGIIEEIPVPSYAGYGIRIKGLWAAGAEKAYVGLAGDLVKASVTDAAPAPETFLAIDGDAVSSGGFYLELYAEQRIVGEELTVLLAGREPAGRELEYSYRLDGGPWSVWKPRSEIRLGSLLSGLHELHVRSRTALLKVDPTPAKLVFATGVAAPPQGRVSIPAN